jgi:hypothetical protein
VIRALNHLGCKDAHGAVIGREGFVELSHTTADAWVLLYQINPVSHVGEINSRLNSGDAAAYDEHSFLRQSKHLLLPSYLNVAFPAIEKARLPPGNKLGSPLPRNLTLLQALLKAILI